MKMDEFANKVDPDKVAYKEHPPVGLHCGPSLNSQYNIAWVKIFQNFADLSFVFCFFFAL